MHAVQDGAANKSYGLAVASLAGVPKTVIKKAKQKLQQLESGQPKNQPLTATQVKQEHQLSLIPEPSDVEEALAKVNPDDLTPRQALEELYRLKALL